MRNPLGPTWMPAPISSNTAALPAPSPDARPARARVPSPARRYRRRPPGPSCPTFRESAQTASEYLGSAITNPLRSRNRTRLIGSGRVRADNDRASPRDAHKPTGTVGAVLDALLATIPSPDRGVWYLGPLPLRAYALCIIAGIIVAIWWGERRWVARGGSRARSPTSPCGRCRSAWSAGGSTTCITDNQKYFGPGKDPLAALQDLERRPRHLGCDRARRRRCVDRVPPQGHSAAGDGGRARARHRGGAGHRPARQLLQPGALRRRHDVAVGPGDLPPGRPGGA